MSYKGHVKNGAVVLDDPVQLPEGAAVTVDLAPADRSGLLTDLFRDVAGQGSDLPPDGSSQHDHYIYGTPKR